jgi:large subunit ribosomal protein L30
MLRIKLIRSPIGHNWRNRRTIAALGLRKVHQVVEQPDNPSVRGMIHHVQSMVTVEVVEGEPAGKGVKGKEVKGKATAAPKTEPKAKKGAEKPIEEVPQPDASEGEAAEAKPKKAPAKKKVEENS